MGEPRPLIDAAVLRETMDRFTTALRAHREELDSLNVYPVPDGDTGTNMLLTQEEVAAELGRLPGDADLEAVGTAISRSALLGARGNSGVILAQVLRGLVAVLCRGEAAGADGLRAALDEASREAYRAVARPMEGTALTVLADAARAGAEADGADPGSVAEHALAAAGDSLERTRVTLPALAEAGVVDAGGKGLVLLLDALAAALTGRGASVEVGPSGPVGHADGSPPARLDQKFEVQYLLEADEASVPSLRERLELLGDSLVVVGGGGLYKVHVHTNNPDAAVEVASPAGSPRDVEVVDLEEQVAEHCIAGQARAVRVAERQRTSVVAVAEGDGLARIFRSLGAVVVPGGPGNNPSVRDLVEAIEAAPAPAVVVLPNHRNVVPAAERAAGESSKEVAVVPTRSVPAGLAAAAALSPMADGKENAEHMEAAADACRSGELTRAVREAETPAGPVRRGDWLGVVDGAVRASGDEPGKVAVELASGIREPAHEILTLIVGSDAAPGEADAVAAALRDAFPDLEIEVHGGDQPRYAYLVGLE